MIPRHLEAIFCDDIRHEMGGKLSFIGVYSGELFVPAFPVTLPKLCVAAKVVTPLSEPLRSLSLRVLKDDETLQEIALSEDDLAAASDSAQDTREDDQPTRIQAMQFLLVFSPMQFNEPCTLKVRAQTDKDELRGLALTVASPPPAAELVSEEAGV